MAQGDPHLLRFTLDEAEHQALDTLDATPEDDPGIDEDPEVVAAVAVAEPLFARLAVVSAERLLAAAQALAATEDRGELDPAALTRLRARLSERPELALALPSAIEAVGVALGLEREGLAWRVLLAVGERGSARVRGGRDSPRDEDDEAQVERCADAIAERLAVAHPRQGPTPERQPPSRPLRVFRSAAVAAAGPEVRARFLAADQPEQIELARVLVTAIDEPEQLVAKFDEARAALVEAQPGSAPAGSPPPPEALIDGPKRKFTVVHLVLALIVLGLTVWHYGFR